MRDHYPTPMNRLILIIERPWKQLAINMCIGITLIITIGILFISLGFKRVERDPMKKGVMKAKIIRKSRKEKVDNKDFIRYNKRVGKR